jgi:hypothetical protein
MLGHEIPNAYLIRALARRQAERCDGCGSRMFVKSTSGLCPFCRAGRPPRTEPLPLAADPEQPFVPRLGAKRVPEAWRLARVADRILRGRLSAAG